VRDSRASFTIDQVVEKLEAALDRRALEESLSMDGPLPSWNDAAARRAIERFVKSVTEADGPAYGPQEKRIAVFDNDGTPWCEKPMPIELGFIRDRLERPLTPRRHPPTGHGLRALDRHARGHERAVQPFRRGDRLRRA
jgi:hypothetical protein